MFSEKMLVFLNKLGKSSPNYNFLLIQIAYSVYNKMNEFVEPTQAFITSENSLFLEWDNTAYHLDFEISNCEFKCFWLNKKTNESKAINGHVKMIPNIVACNQKYFK